MTAETMRTARSSLAGIRSVAVLVATVLVLVATACLAVLGAIGQRASERSDRANLRLASSATADQLGAALVLPVWNFDRAQVDKVLESVETIVLPHDVYAVVAHLRDASAAGGTSVNGRVRDAGGRLVRTDHDPPAEGLVVEERPILSPEGPLGTVRLFVTPRYMEAVFRDEIAALAVRIVLFDLVLVATLFVILFFTVLRPLRKLERYASAVSTGSAPGAPLGERPFHGELESVRRSLERTFALLDERYLSLQANRTMLASVLESVPISVFWKDTAGVYRGCNRVFAVAAGLDDPARVVGRTDHELPWPAEHTRAYRADDERVIRTGQPLRHIRESLHHADGRTLVVETTKVPMFDRDGRPSGVLGVFEDVTERLKAEEEIRRINAELEQRVMDRTQELEVANRDLESFSYSVSHDLRAPLRAISGFSRVLIEDFGGTSPAEAVRLMGVIERNTKQMGQLIDDLLAFSRLKRQALDRQTVDPRPLIDRVLETVRAAEPADRRIDVHIGTLPACSADPALLRQVFFNLVSNAFKYTRPRAQAEITIDSTTGSAGETVYRVRDNGTGFDMRYADQLFRVFQRLHRDDEFEGTGVGLAIVERIVRRHGGRVWADAEPDRGATFCFTLTGGAVGAN